MAHGLATRRDVTSWFGGAFATIVLTGAIGAVTGALDVVIVFAHGHMGEFVVWTLIAALLGAVVGMAVRGRVDRRRMAELEAKLTDDVIGAVDHYHYLKNLGKNPQLIVRDHTTVHVQGEREAVKLAELEAKIARLERELSERGK